ncbi:hypothetical protein HMPREF9131_0279, partial [Peptoniphilus sp. oral taxon 836 str. F0141]
MLNTDAKFSYNISLDSDIILKYNGQTDRDLTTDELNLNVDLKDAKNSGEYPLNYVLPQGFNLV